MATERDDRGATVADTIAEVYQAVPGPPAPFPASGWVVNESSPLNVDSKY